MVYSSVPTLGNNNSVEFTLSNLKLDPFTSTALIVCHNAISCSVRGFGLASVCFLCINVSHLGHPYQDLPRLRLAVYNCVLHTGQYLLIRKHQLAKKEVVEVFTYSV